MDLFLFKGHITLHVRL